MPRYSYNQYQRQQQRGALPTLAGMLGGGQVKMESPGGQMTNEMGQPMSGAYAPPRYAPKNRFLDMLSGGGGASQASQMNFAIDQMMRESAMDKAMREELERLRLGGERELRGMDMDREKFKASEAAKLQTDKFANERSNTILTNVAEILKAKGIMFNEEDIPRLKQILQDPSVQAALAKMRQDVATADTETDKQLNVIPLQNNLAGMSAQADITEFAQNRDMARRMKEAELKQKEVDASTAGVVMGPGFAGNKLTGDYQSFMTPYQAYQATEGQPSSQFMNQMYKRLLTNSPPSDIEFSRTYRVPGAPSSTNAPLSGAYTPEVQMPPPPVDPRLSTPATNSVSDDVITINGKTYRRKR